MQRFFFDLVATDQRAFDYSGRYFRDTESAHQHAQILSLDSGCLDEWQGGEIEVRDPAGARLFSVPIVPAPELQAAA